MLGNCETWISRRSEEFRSSGVQEFRSSGVQEFRSSGVQEFRSSGVQEFRSSGVMFGVQEFRSSGVQEFRSSRGGVHRRRKRALPFGMTIARRCRSRLLNSRTPATPELLLLSFLRDLFQAIQPGLVTSRSGHKQTFPLGVSSGKEAAQCQRNGSPDCKRGPDLCGFMRGRERCCPSN